MPTELVVTAPYKLKFREYKEPSLNEKEVRIKSEFGSAKHGTELGFYRGTASLARGQMNEHNIFVADDKKREIYPYLLGNMSVGRVVETGKKAVRFKPGDRVFLYGGFRQTHTVSEDDVWPAPEGMSPESIVYLDPAKYAFGGISSAGVSLGWRVAVFGLGAIGQMAVQMAALSGAIEIFAIDAYEIRRQAAHRYGATKVLNPVGSDVGRIIKENAVGPGVDCAIEASGVAAALHQAIRSTVRGGTIVTVGLYEGGAADLRLAEDWHRNQQVMLASQGPNFPSHRHHSWAGQRMVDTVFELLRLGRLKTDGLVLPIVPFEKAAEAYKEIDEHPEKSIKLGVRY